MEGGVLIVTRGVLYIISLLVNILPCIRLLRRLYDGVTSEGLLELNILGTNIIDVSLFCFVPMVTQLFGYPLDTTIRQATVFQALGCDEGERFVVIANMCLFQHIAAIAITNMLGLTIHIYATYLQASLQLMDKNRTVSFIILAWTLSILLAWPPMLIRCVYVDAIYMVSLLWLIPLILFSVFSMTMQCHLGWSAKRYQRTNHSPYVPEVAHAAILAHQNEGTVSSASSIWPISDTTDAEPNYSSALQDEQDGPQLRIGNIYRLFLTQILSTLTVMPFPTLQLFDALGIPVTPSMFWHSSQGQVVWNILQSLPYAHFIFQPLLIECNWKRGVLDVHPITMVLFKDSSEPQMSGTNGQCVTDNL